MLLSKHVTVFKYTVCISIFYVHLGASNIHIHVEKFTGCKPIINVFPSLHKYAYIGACALVNYLQVHSTIVTSKTAKLQITVIL